jgi:hypothetical protein
MYIEKNIGEFLKELSSKAPTPGGGGASAGVGAYAMALGIMVTNLTIGKKKYESYEEELKEIRLKLTELEKKLADLVDKDAEAFTPLSLVYKLPSSTDKEKEFKEQELEKALLVASLVPKEIMETIYEGMGYFETLVKKGSALAVSDVGAGINLAFSALESASLNIFINTSMMKDRKKALELNNLAEDIIENAKKLKVKVYNEVLGKIK